MLFHQFRYTTYYQIDKLEDAGMPEDNINISDVIEVIATDPDFTESTMFNGGAMHSNPNPNPNPQPPNNRHKPKPSTSSKSDAPYVKITEQPASKALRFRYECEGRSAGSIPGASSTPENKSFPSIQVVNYKGKAVVVVSCVTKDSPYRPHPHNLVGRDGCRRGVCTLEIPQDTMTATFSNLGIQCVKKKDIEGALLVREEIRVDPFRTGFSHRNQPTSIDLNAVRLCFQVFLEQDGRFSVPLPAVVSEPIYDKKAMSDLNIIKLSDCVSYVDGGRKDVILLCEKVAKEDIQVRFYEERDGQLYWEGFADFQPSQVHKQHAIWFRTPRYRTLDITEPVKVFIQLRRPSDGQTSESLPFELLPLDSDPNVLKRKRQKIEDPTQILRQLQEHDPSNFQYAMNIQMDPVKAEPRDTTPSPGGYVFAGLSPMSYPASTSGLSPQPQQYCNIQLDVPNTVNTDPYMLQFGASTSTFQDAQHLMQQQQLWGNEMPVPNNLDGAGATIMNIDNNSSSIYNLDSQKILEMAETIDQIPDIVNLSINDINGSVEQNNMTDSLTTLANNAIDNMGVQ